MIKPNRWYAWQMMPGYGGGPYYSPIFVQDVAPCRNGRSELTLRFINAFYAPGVQDFEKTLQVLLQGKDFLFAAVDPDEHRGVVVSEITMAWLRRHCLHLFEQGSALQEQTDAQATLASVFGWPRLHDAPDDGQAVYLPEILRPTSVCRVALPSGRTVELPQCCPSFERWRGALVFTFGNKPLLAWEGKPIFAELLVLRLLQQDGWDGVWVSSYGGEKYVTAMPSDPMMTGVTVSLPSDKADVLEEIRKAGAQRAGGCFDIVAWRGTNILCCECKRKGKDALRATQLAWIDGALRVLSPRSLLVVEWAERYLTLPTANTLGVIARVRRMSRISQLGRDDVCRW